MSTIHEIAQFFDSPETVCAILEPRVHSGFLYFEDGSSVSLRQFYLTHASAYVRRCVHNVPHKVAFLTNSLEDRSGSKSHNYGTQGRRHYGL